MKLRSYLQTAKKVRTEMADIRIRAAGGGDANFLARVILTAGRGHVNKGIWEVILGMSRDQCLHLLGLLALTVVPHLFHHSCCLLPDVEGVSRAGLGGYDPNALGNTQLLKAVQEVYELLEGAAPSMSRDGAPPRILGCIAEPVSDAWMIDSVAAVPEFRRQGIVGKLLEAMLTQGRAKGFRRAQGNICIGNTAAQGLYERHGFAIMDEMRSPYFEPEIGSPGIARMLRDL
jgi:GNAT superfamily N-acetyltransferase